MVADANSPTDRQQQTVLVLGPDIPRAPSSEGVAFSTDPRTACDAIVISEPIDEATWRALAEGRHALVPIVDFGVNKGLSADFSAEALTRENVQAALGECQRIWRRLANLPLAELKTSPDTIELSVLALAYSRDKPIEAKRTSEARATVYYPLLLKRFGLGAADLRATLAFLANLNLLNPRFFARAHLCKACGSSRLCAFEACVKCGSGALNQEVLIHHYRCGYQTRESEFVVQRDLVCPKCRRVLKHFGVDYDKPGVAIRCESCAANMHEPQARLSVPRLRANDECRRRGDDRLVLLRFDRPGQRRGARRPSAQSRSRAHHEARTARLCGHRLCAAHGRAAPGRQALQAPDLRCLDPNLQRRRSANRARRRGRECGLSLRCGSDGGELARDRFFHHHPGQGHSRGLSGDRSRAHRAGARAGQVENQPIHRGARGTQLRTCAPPRTRRSSSRRRGDGRRPGRHGARGRGPLETARSRKSRAPLLVHVAFRLAALCGGKPDHSHHPACAPAPACGATRAPNRFPGSPSASAS